MARKKSNTSWAWLLVPIIAIGGLLLYRKGKGFEKVVIRTGDIKMNFKDIDPRTLTGKASLILEVFNPSNETFSGDKLAGNITLDGADLGDVLLTEGFTIAPVAYTRLTVPIRLQLKTLGPEVTKLIANGIQSLLKGKAPSMKMKQVGFNGFFYTGITRIPVSTKFNFNIS